MNGELSSRKLSAIMSADAKDYSRLMGSDEEATVYTLKKYREVITGLIRYYQGRVVDSPGDNLLAEFGSVVHAVQCGFEIQKSLQAENAKLPQGRRMDFRIGINLGDVIQERDRIYGDGVNVAARLESLAEPGGICVSGSAYDQLESKFPFGCEYLGEQSLKNIAAPIRVYRLTPDGDSQGCVSGAHGRPSSKRFFLVAVLGLLISFAAGSLTWTIYQRQTSQTMDTASLDQMTLPLSDKPSIAVLPFKSLSDNERDRLIAKALTEDLITALSRVQELFVIASASSFAYEGKPSEIKQVSEELGIRYVLDGSVQRSMDRLRFNARLVDAIAGHQLWADRFDRAEEDLFVLQDDLVRRILLELQVRLTDGELARIRSRTTNNLDAWLLQSQGWKEGLKSTRESMFRARGLFEAARKKDPNWERPLVGLAWVYWHEARMGWTVNRDEWMDKSLALAEQAVEWAPEEPGGYQMLGMLALHHEEYDNALMYREKAYSLAPNDWGVAWGLGAVLCKTGDPKRAVHILRKAARQNPNHPVALSWTMAETYLLAGDYPNAIQTSKAAISGQPDAAMPHIVLTAAYVASNRTAEAYQEAARVLEIDPDFAVSTWMKTRLLKNPATTEAYARLLLAAGLPENPS